MKGFWKPFSFFFLCLLVALIALFPLRLALSFAELPPEIEIDGASGSVFTGEADRVRIRQVPLHNVSYRIAWECFLKLSICVDVIFDEGDLLVGHYPFNGQSEIFGGKLKLPLTTPGLLPPNLLVKPQGDAFIRSLNARFANQKISNLNLVGEWQKAGIEGEQNSFGDYRITINSQASQYVAEVTDLTGLIEVKGRALFNPNARYTLNLKMSARPGLPQTYKNAIELIAKKKKANQYELTKSGVIPKNIATYFSFSSS